MEIRELIVRTEIVTGERKDQISQGGNNQPIPPDLLVEQCVEKVLKALRKKMER